MGKMTRIAIFLVSVSSIAWAECICPRFNNDNWYCPNGRTVSLKRLFRCKGCHVKQSQLRNAIGRACASTMGGYCRRERKNFFQIFQRGDCSVPAVFSYAKRIGNHDFITACKTHDACYSMQRGQATCDQEFCSNLKNSCDWTNHYSDCQEYAWIFYETVNNFGRSAYRQSR